MNRYAPMQNVSISIPLSPAGVTLLRAFTAEVQKLVAGSATAAPVAGAASLDDAPAEPTQARRGRKPNAEKAAAAAAAPADDLDLGGGDDAAEGDELGLDEPAAAPAKKLTLADDVIPAFRAALDRVKGDKSKLAAVLAEYNTKSVQSLPEPKFAEVLAKLAKLK